MYEIQIFPSFGNFQLKLRESGTEGMSKVRMSKDEVRMLKCEVTKGEV